MRIATSSPTKGANWPMSKSLRNSVVVASKPIQGRPATGDRRFLVHGRIQAPPGRVMPLIVRSPVISPVVSPVTSIPVDTKLTTGVVVGAEEIARQEMRPRARASR